MSEQAKERLKHFVGQFKWLAGAIVAVLALYAWGYGVPPLNSQSKHHNPETECHYANDAAYKAKLAPQQPAVVICFQSHSQVAENGSDAGDGQPPNSAVPLSRYVARKIVSDPITLFTIILALFTWRLIVVGRDQHRAAMGGITLARAEFNATHRPRIILREAIIGSVLEGEPIHPVLTLANVGETPGTIVRSHVRVEVVSEDVERLFLHISVEQHSDLGEVRLAPGEHRILNYPRDDAPAWHKDSFSKASGPLRTIHLTGQILYVDELGVPRRTAFRRVLKPERQRFYRLPDDYEPDLDYAD